MVGVRVFLVVIAVAVAGELALAAAGGRGPVLPAVPRLELAVQSAALAASITIAYIGATRFAVLGELPSLWLAAGFAGYAAIAVIHLVTRPGLVLEAPGWLSIPGTGAWWPFHLMWTMLAAGLVAAALTPAGAPVETRPRLARIVLIGTAVAVAAAAGIMFGWGPELPALVADGRFTGLNVAWTGGLALCFALAAGLALVPGRRRAAPVLGHAASTGALLAIRFANDVGGGRLYDAAWFWNRALVLAALGVLLARLLGDYRRLLGHSRDLAQLAAERASELQATLDGMADAVFVVDGHQLVVEANAPAARLLGYEANRALVGRPVAELGARLGVRAADGRKIEPRDLPIPRALQGESIRGFLVRARRADGAEVLLDISASPVAAGLSVRAAAVVVCRDVTALESARSQAVVARVATAIASALGEADVLTVLLTEARAALGADMTAVFVVADEGRSLRLAVDNGVPAELAERIARFPLDARSFMGLAATTGRVQLVEDVAAAPPEFPTPRLGARFGFRSLAAVPLRVRGETIGVLAYATRRPRLYSPREVETLGTLGDLAAVALANARLYDEARLERARLAALIEQSPEGVIFFEAGSGRIVVGNPAASAVVGRPLENESPMSAHSERYGLRKVDGSLYPPDALPSARALRGQVVLGEEMVVEGPGGRAVPILVNAGPIRDAAGGITGAVAVFQDISRLKALERQREEFVSIVAHELRTPLGVVAHYAEALRRLAGDHARRAVEAQAIEAIALSVRRLATIVNDLLDVSRIEARRLRLAPEPVDVAELAVTLVERLHEVRRDHPIAVEARGKPVRLLADPARLEQVLVNLLGNAAKFSPAGAPIRVAIDHRDGVVEIAVSDEGPGIPVDELPRLFDRFYRTPAGTHGPDGVGLGLYIARGLVEAHGGTIAVDSAPGRGTTFTVRLPLAPCATAA